MCSSWTTPILTVQSRHARVFKFNPGFGNCETPSSDEPTTSLSRHGMRHAHVIHCLSIGTWALFEFGGSWFVRGGPHERKRHGKVESSVGLLVEVLEYVRYLSSEGPHIDYRNTMSNVHTAPPPKSSMLHAPATHAGTMYFIAMFFFLLHLQSMYVPTTPRSNPMMTPTTVAASSRTMVTGGTGTTYA